MSTITQDRYPQQNDERSDALRSTLTRAFVMNWELVLIVAIFALAVFTRFYMLGDRAMSHDESLHTFYSWELYTQGNFDHTPLMHGPILFHANALFYALFGDNDFSGRIYSSLLGVLMVMSPLLFRRWLGRWGTILACLMLLISPLILYYNRYIRHDTPSILAAIVMVWAIMMYLNGPANQRRRAHWLYILSAAMIWNLGSKETAFIYIAIFGLFLTLYWFARMAQSAYNISGRVLFNGFIMSVLIAGVAALGMYIVLDITPMERVAALNPNFTWFNNLIETGGTGNTLAWTAAIFAFSAVLTAVVAVFLFIVYTLVRTLQKVLNLPDNLLLTLFLGALAIFAVLWVSFNVTGLLGDVETRSFLVWSLLVVTVVGTVLIGTLIWSLRGHMDRAPVREILFIMGVAALVLAGLIIFEEFSHIDSTPENAVEVQAQPIPGEEGIAAVSGSLSWSPIILIWVIATVIIGGLIYSRRAGWWKWLSTFPELDVLIVMGALILPWLTAVFIVAAGGTPAEHAAIGNALPALLAANLPGVSSPTEVGQFVIGFLAWLPMMTLAIVTGLIWNWRRFLVCFVIFHAIFAFFFTTVFTNIEGLYTGMIYSLQYWLEQQGERRGSQPQYYYLLIVMPMYEYLPIVGGVLAMFSGLVVFWRRRTGYVEARNEVRMLESENIAFDQTAGGTVEFMSLEEAARASDNPAAVDDDDEQAEPSGGKDPVRTTEVDMQRPLPERIAEAEAAWTADRVDAADSDDAMSSDNAMSSDDAISSDDATSSDNVVVATPAQQSGPVLARPVAAANAAARLRSFRELTEVPFLLFVSWWAIFNLIGYTLAGEKMPWLGTHLSTPLIFLSAWYFGGVFDRIDFRKFTDRGWIYLLLVPFMLVAGFQLLAAPLSGQSPFMGVEDIQLRWTYNWLAAGVVVIGVIYGMYRLSRHTGMRHLWQMVIVSVFAVLSILTFRAAWMASFINYDYATEFLVYAHATPGTKLVVNQLEELSLRTTDGMDLRFAYDNKMSWPGVWYFRNFENDVFMGENPTFQAMDGAAAVVVGSDKLSVVEPLLEDRYQRFDYTRMWWPMQDYFGLNAQRVVNAFDLTADNIQASGIRRGLFDIWWARDYDTYGNAVGKSYDVTQWPVREDMSLYVRRDIAAQVWPYGLGDGTVGAGLTDSAEASACVTNWLESPAVSVFQLPPSEMGVNAMPIGISVGEDGRIYVADARDINSRVLILDADGNVVEALGQRGQATQEGAFFERPHSVAVAPDGSFYVVDTWNFLIRRFNAQGEQIDQFGSRNERGFAVEREPVDGFWGPRDMAVDTQGNLYVADTGNKRVRVYTAEGDYLWDIGSSGSAPGQLDEPAGLVTHPDGRVFVADTWNRRISVFQNDGTFLTSYNVRAWFDDLGNRPYLALDAARDLLYVTDPEGGRVMVYDIALGDCIGSFGRLNRENPNDAQFSTLGGVAVDAEGFVYVTDMGTARVMKFEPFPEPAVAIEGLEGDVIIEPIEGAGDEAALPNPETTGEAIPAG